MKYQDNGDSVDESPISSVAKDEKYGDVTNEERLDSTNTLMKNSTGKRSSLSTLGNDWESCSEECDCSSGYDPDSDGDETKSSRILGAGNLKSPEILRRDASMKSHYLSSDAPAAPVLLQKRKLSSPCENWEQDLEDDVEADLFEDNVESDSFIDDMESLESVKILASTLIDGRKSEANRLEFIPDISSVNNRDSRDYLQVLSPGSSTGTSSLLRRTHESLESMEVGGSVTPEKKGYLKLINEIDESDTIVENHTSAATAEIRDSLEDKSSLETTSDEVGEEKSDDNLFGTPQGSYKRKRRSTEKLNETLENLQKREDVISKENVKIERSCGSKLEQGERDASDDDSIVVEIEDSPVVRRSKRKQQENTNEADVIKLCEYPVGKADTVIVAVDDYVTLEDETYLNDNIIDFYLTYLKHNVLPIEDQGRVHIFSTFFYKALLRSPKKNAKKVAPYEIDPTLTSPEKRHCRVVRWIKQIDLFQRDLVIIPICEHSHWYLLLIVKPGLIAFPKDSEKRKMEGDPFVIVLDSLGGNNDIAVTNIWLYLIWEWKKKCGGDQADEVNFCADAIKTVRPKKPHQENGTDCGIYLLHYVEKILPSLSKFLQPSLPDLTNWFTSEEVGRKRGEIVHLIKSLTSEQNPGKRIEYPNIRLAVSNPKQLRENSKSVTKSPEDETFGRSSQAQVKLKNGITAEVDPASIFSSSLKTNSGNDSFSENSCDEETSAAVNPNIPEIQVSPIDGISAGSESEINIRNVLLETLGQLSPNVRNIQDVNNVPSNALFYASDNSASSENDNVEEQNPKRQIKRVKLKHFQETESESVKMFNKFMFEGVSSGDSDIFSDSDYEEIELSKNLSK